jgi:hypothetical protein
MSAISLGLSYQKFQFAGFIASESQASLVITFNPKTWSAQLCG